MSFLCTLNEPTSKEVITVTKPQDLKEGSIVQLDEEYYVLVFSDGSPSERRLVGVPTLTSTGKGLISLPLSLIVRRLNPSK